MEFKEFRNLVFIDYVVEEYVDTICDQRGGGSKAPFLYDNKGKLH